MNSTKPFLTIQTTDLTNLLRALVRRPRASDDVVGEGATVSPQPVVIDEPAEDETLLDALAVMFRSIDENALEPSDRELLHAFFAAQAERQARRSASASGAPSSITLRPRHRETLRWLLTGATEKEIAAGLGLSVHTVHQYVKAIYRRFRVTSRAQLMAAQLRQRPMLQA